MKNGEIIKSKEISSRMRELCKTSVTIQEHFWNMWGSGENEQRDIFALITAWELNRFQLLRMLNVAYKNNKYVQHNYHSDKI